jgi:hypothetical protein
MVDSRHLNGWLSSLKLRTESEFSAMSSKTSRSGFFRLNKDAKIRNGGSTPESAAGGIKGILTRVGVRFHTIPSLTDIWRG